MAFHYFNKGSPAIGRLTEPFISLANTLGDHASSPFADERISGEKRLTIGIGGDVSTGEAAGDATSRAVWTVRIS